MVVTNGMISEKNLRVLLPFVDAYNIDLKGFTQEVYDVCGGKLKTVKRTIEIAHAAGAHVEITTLLIPGLNDVLDDIAREAAWIASLSPDGANIPLHLTRFFPQYRFLDVPATPIETLYAAEAVARRYLNDVLLGNVCHNHVCLSHRANAVVFPFYG